MVPPIVVFPKPRFWKVCDAPSVSGMLHEFEPVLSVMPLLIVKALPSKPYPLVLKVIELISSPVILLVGAGRGLAAKFKSSPPVGTAVSQFKAVFQLLSAPRPFQVSVACAIALQPSRASATNNWRHERHDLAVSGF